MSSDFLFCLISVFHSITRNAAHYFFHNIYAVNHTDNSRSTNKG